MSAFDVIKVIRLTEKSSRLTEKFNRYTFSVQPSATKEDIKGAVEQLFGVKVVGVNTARYDGKLRRKRTRQEGRTPSWKKAVVTLKEGDRIDLV